jgi:hypothetical protein
LSFTIPIIDNNSIDADRTIDLQLSDTTADGIGNQITATVTVRNDDSAISFASPTFRVPEAVVNGKAYIEIVRSGNTTGTVSVDFITTTNGTALSPDDFELVTNTVTFAEGESNKFVGVSIVNDALTEGDETVVFTLTNAMNSLLSEPSTSTLTIVDDDFAAGLLAFSQPEYSVSESGGAATISVIRTNGSLGFVSVSFSATGGTAVSGRHYTPTNGILSFGPGEMIKSFTVQVANDNLPEGDRTVLLTLSSPQGTGILGTNQTVLNILEDDAAF